MTPLYSLCIHLQHTLTNPLAIIGALIPFTNLICLSLIASSMYLLRNALQILLKRNCTSLRALSALSLETCVKSKCLQNPFHSGDRNPFSPSDRLSIWCDILIQSKCLLRLPMDSLIVPTQGDMSHELKAGFLVNSQFSYSRRVHP